MTSPLDIGRHCDASVNEPDTLQWKRRRNGLTWACRLPCEIWIMIAELMTVKGIEALGFTCHALHTALSDSMTLWRSVVCDLLVIAPNILLSHSLASATAHDLRSKALRFCEIDRAFEVNNKPSRSWIQRRLRLPESSTQYSLAIVPGTSYVVYMSMPVSIRLFSCVSGDEVDACDRPADLRETNSMRESELFVYPSATYGNVVIVPLNWIDRNGGEQSAVWLLQVQMSPEPKLHHLAVAKVDEPPHYISLADSTLAVGWGRDIGHSAIQRFDIPGVEGKATSLDDVPWSMPYLVVDYMELLTPTTVVFVTGSDDIVLAYLSPHQPSTSARYRTLTAASTSELSFYLRYEGSGAAADLCIDVFQGLDGFTLHARNDYMLPPETSLRIQLKPGTPWLRAVETYGNSSPDRPALTHLETRRVVAHDEVARRLGQDAVRKDVRQAPRPFNLLVYTDAEIDEWTGVCISQELEDDGGCEHVVVVTV